MSGVSSDGRPLVCHSNSTSPPSGSTYRRAQIQFYICSRDLHSFIYGIWGIISVVFLRECFCFWWKHLPLHDVRCVDVGLNRTFDQFQQEKELKCELPSAVQAAGVRQDRIHHYRCQNGSPFAPHKLWSLALSLNNQQHHSFYLQLFSRF